MRALTLGVVIVVPLVGTWIEILNIIPPGTLVASFPSWERGLKSHKKALFLMQVQSFPSWERGLKFPMDHPSADSIRVVPLVGTWIEIYPESGGISSFRGRSPRGNVD